MSVVIRRAEAIDVAGIRELLDCAHLPVAGVEENINRFVVMLLEEGTATEIVGAVGALRHDGDALMRYAVDGPWRAPWEEELLRLFVRLLDTFEMGSLVAEVGIEQQPLFEVLGFRPEWSDGAAPTDLGAVVMVKECGPVESVYAYSLSGLQPTVTSDNRSMMYSHSGWKTRPQNL